MKRIALVGLLLVIAALASSAPLVAEPAVPESRAGVASADAALVEIIRNGENWTCIGPVNIDLVRITNPGGSNDALRLGSNCSGRIGRVELSGPMADGIKVLNAGTVAHDLVIESGFVFCGQAAGGVHQDGIQAMGGFRISFHVAVNCLGGGGGNYFPARGGSGASTPTDIVCNGCAFGPLHPNNVQIQTSIRSGIRNSLVCRPFSGRQPIAIGSTAQSPVNVGSLIVPSNDPRCSSSGLLAYVGGGSPPPPPPPPAPPMLSVCQASAIYLYLCWPTLQSVVSFNFYVDSDFVSHSLNPALARTRFRKLSGTHEYAVEAVYADGRSARSTMTVTK